MMVIQNQLYLYEHEHQYWIDFVNKCTFQIILKLIPKQKQLHFHILYILYL